ncbi:MAG: hypothetical protein Ct9H300mP32_4670 [Verrucomicrobiota bacterium]|nr:MAG: hypothetical protein Ct9H300mP32_4670 [Verrucomicrobiota bacterium]
MMPFRSEKLVHCITLKNPRGTKRTVDRSARWPVASLPTIGRHRRKTPAQSQNSATSAVSWLALCCNTLAKPGSRLVRSLSCSLLADTQRQGLDAEQRRRLAGKTRVCVWGLVQAEPGQDRANIRDSIVSWRRTDRYRRSRLVAWRGYCRHRKCEQTPSIKSTSRF